MRVSPRQSAKARHSAPLSEGQPRRRDKATWIERTHAAEPSAKREDDKNPTIKPSQRRSGARVDDGGNQRSDQTPATQARPSDRRPGTLGFGVFSGRGTLPYPCQLGMAPKQQSSAEMPSRISANPAEVTSDRKKPPVSTPPDRGEPTAAYLRGRGRESRREEQPHDHCSSARRALPEQDRQHPRRARCGLSRRGRPRPAGNRHREIERA